MLNLVFAAEQDLGSLEGTGALSVFTRDAGGAMSLFNKVISNIIAVLTIVAGLWFIFQFILGAFGWLTAGGDKAAMENARKKITNAIVGLVIVVTAIFIIDLLGKLLGLDILNPGVAILNIWK